MMGIGSDLRVTSPNPGAVWSKDGRFIYFTTADTPYKNLYKLKLENSSIESVISKRTVDGYSISNDKKIAFIAMTSTKPCELYLKSDKVEQLTHFNSKLLSNLKIIEPELFTFKNRLGRLVDGWIIKPVDFDEKEKVPCVLEIHGGPRGVYGDGIFQEFQLLAAEGYAVIYTNPRGSAGYEEDYTQAVMRHYGEVDYEDLMDFTFTALEKYPWIDKERLGVTGGSYGGYMTNWIISQTDIFKAAVTFRSISNWVSKFGVSDIGYMQPESISGHKTYWGEAITEQLKHSPIYYVNNVKTPCLIIHSEEDYRCPMDQAEQWFTALKLNNIPTVLVRFPEENHELSRSGKPKHREIRFERMLRWFKEYL
jgi:dipeptidyl aminopeptidase/acylaminoacyl peptidase